MKRILLAAGFLWAGAVLAACQPANFTKWDRETFQTTPITQSVSKTISLRNESDREEQRLLGVGFDGSGDGRQHFRIEKIMVGNRHVADKKIIVPPGSSVNVQITYEPRNMETTKAEFGGWVTGESKRFEPYKPGEEPKPEEIETAIHRVVLLAVYDNPSSGISQIELVGKAVPGPNGEISLPEAGVKECEPKAGTACFTGTFSIDIPKLFTTGPREEKMMGPIRFQITGNKATMRMDDMPPVLFVLEGNGPGEPLEGQPVSAVSIIISGLEGVQAEGTFDGSRMELSDLAFRIRVVVGEIQPEQISTSSPIVDFNIEQLTLTTEEPYVDGRVLFRIDTTLNKTPSGNPIFDGFLGEAKILVRFKGELAL